MLAFVVKFYSILWIIVSTTATMVSLDVVGEESSSLNSFDREHASKSEETISPPPLSMVSPDNVFNVFDSILSLIITNINSNDDNDDDKDGFMKDIDTVASTCPDDNEMCKHTIDLFNKLLVKLKEKRETATDKSLHYTYILISIIVVLKFLVMGLSSFIVNRYCKKRNKRQSMKNAEEGVEMSDIRILVDPTLLPLKSSLSPKSKMMMIDAENT